MLAWIAILVFFIKLNIASAICNEFRHQRAIHQVALPRSATGSAASDNAVEPWLAMFDEGQQKFPWPITSSDDAPHCIETMKKFYLQVTEEHREAALQVKPQLPPAASKDPGSQLSGEAKPRPLMPDVPRHAKTRRATKSQTPFIMAFGFECLGLSGPSVAAEGLDS